MKYIISLEVIYDQFTIHIIVQKYLGKIFTLTARQISNHKDQTKLYNWILKNDFKALTDFFKKEHNIIHSTITFSYGPNLRKLLKSRKREELRQWQM